MKMAKRNGFRWLFVALVILAVCSGFYVKNGKSESEQVLNNYLDSVKSEDFDKAFTYVTFTGVDESADMRKEFESGIQSDKLLSFKIDKFFNDDDTHASAVVSIRLLNAGEQNSVHELIKKNGVWKVSREVSPSSVNHPFVQENLNENSKRPSLAMNYLVQEEHRKGTIGIAQPSSQPTVR